MSQVKTLYHGELRGLGPVQVTVKKEWTESTKKKGTYYTTLIVNGVERYYNPENQNCLQFWAGKAGQTITIVADGAREEATITQMQTGAQIAQPAAPAPAQPPVTPRPQAAPTHQPAPQPTHPTAPSQSQAPTRPPVASSNVGQRVGMAINQAVAYGCHCGELWNPQAIMERASDLIRIAEALEAGKLAPKSSDRKPPGQAD